MAYISIQNNKVVDLQTEDNSSIKSTKQDSTKQILANEQANNQKKINSAIAVNQHGDTLHISGTKKVGMFRELYASTFERLINSKNHLANMFAREGADYVSVKDSNNVNVQTYSGDDNVSLNGNSNNIKVDTGKDNDYVEIGRGVKNADVSLGEGDDIAKIFLSKNMEGIKHIDGGEKGGDDLILKLDKDMLRSDVEIKKDPDDPNKQIVTINKKPVIIATNFVEINMLSYNPLD